MRKRKWNWWDAGLILLAIFVGIGFSQRPWRAWRTQEGVKRDTIAELRETESKNEELLRQRARAESSIGREEMAREDEYLKKGEIRAESTP